MLDEIAMDNATRVRLKSQCLTMAVHQENPLRKLTAPEARRHSVVKWVYLMAPSASAIGPMECKFEHEVFGSVRAG
jgi:hypothetical protein